MTVYGTAAQLIAKESVLAHEGDVYINPAGFYMTTERHAFLFGMMDTMCGLPLAGMIAFWAEADWTEHESPERCPTCLTEAPL